MATDRPRLILHIGTHKTGTSALQQAFETQRQGLLDAGICYPATSRAPWPELPKHCSVYHAAASGDAQVQAAEAQALRDEFARSGARCLLLSEEGLSEPDPNVSRFFAAWARDFDLTVVCLLRRQDRFVEALFNQFVREAARREARPLLAFARASATRQRLDYHALLSRWAALPARVVALDFDGPAVREAGIVAAFSAAAGVALPAVHAAPANRSSDMRLALALNQLNRQRMPYQVDALLRAGRRLAREGWPAQRHALGRQERMRLLEECQRINDRLALDFGVQFDRQMPADEGPLAVETADPAYLLALLATLSQTDSAPTSP